MTKHQAMTPLGPHSKCRQFCHRMFSPNFENNISLNRKGILNRITLMEKSKHLAPTSSMSMKLRKCVLGYLLGYLSMLLKEVGSWDKL